MVEHSPQILASEEKSHHQHDYTEKAVRLHLYVNMSQLAIGRYCSKCWVSGVLYVPGGLRSNSRETSEAKVSMAKGLELPAFVHRGYCQKLGVLSLILRMLPTKFVLVLDPCLCARQLQQKDLQPTCTHAVLQLAYP